MRLKPNRIMISKSEVLDTIYKGAGAHASDLGFASKAENRLNPIMFKNEIESIKDRNFPLSKQVLDALKSGKIILGRNTENTGSVLFAYGMDSSKREIVKVFINMTKFIQVVPGKIDINTGEPLSKVVLKGGYEEFYNLLLAAYVGMNAEKCYNSPTITKMTRQFYTDMMAQITSRNFGNPGDGVKFRFITDVLFYNGELSGREVAEITMFSLDTANMLASNYPDFFNKNPEGLKIERWIEIINAEFQVFKEPLKLNKFIVGGVNGLGENGIYMIDNMAYILSIMTAKCRRSKAINGGYMLRSLEVNSMAFINDIQRTLS